MEDSIIKNNNQIKNILKGLVLSDNFLGLNENKMRKYVKYQEEKERT